MCACGRGGLVKGDERSVIGLAVIAHIPAIVYVSMQEARLQRICVSTESEWNSNPNI